MINMEIELVIPDTALMKGDGPQIVQEELVAAMNASVEMARAAIEPGIPVDTGALQGGLQGSLSGQPAEVLGRVFDPLGYAIHLEAGTKPHWPPAAPLEAWVQRKLSVAANEVRSVAFLVARAIAKRGLPKRRFFRKAFGRVRGRIRARFREAQARIVERLSK